jgi:PleD family two-component response regulator
MPETVAREAAMLGDRARAALEVGISFGVSEHGLDGQSLDELLRAADSKLYADKGIGPVRRARPPTAASSRRT